MLACPSRASEPIHPTRLHNLLLRHSNQTKIPLSTLFCRWTERQPSRNPCRSLSLFLVPQSCRFWKLVIHGQDFHNISPTLQFPNVRRRISLYYYARCCSSQVSPHYNYSFSNNRPEEIPSAGKHMARPRCFLSESNPYDFTIALLKNLCFIRTLPQSTISPSRYPN